MFGTAIIDPPWAYERASKHERLKGYSTDHQYKAIDLERLKQLPLKDLVDYVFLWTTGPFIESAYSLLRAWGFDPITFLAWVKCQHLEPGKELPFKPTYGVGYWFRGCVEPIILAKRPGVKSIRTPWVGLLCENAEHSRKPDTLHELIETDFPGPYLELFGRRDRPGWTIIGNEAPGYEGQDITESLKSLC